MDNIVFVLDKKQLTINNGSSLILLQINFNYERKMGRRNASSNN